MTRLPRRKTVKKHEKKANRVVFALLVVFSVSMLVPFLWMLLTAFKTQAETTSVNPFVVFPTSVNMDSFARVTATMPFGILYFNTLVLIAGRIVFAVLTALMAGYAFGRLNFSGKSFFFGLVLMQMMIPGQIFIIPQFLMVSGMGMLNTHFALLFPGLVTAFGTFLLRQHFMTLPRELEEAARIDGCNVGQSFIFVMVPLVRAGMVALGVFTALFAYRELLWPLIVNTSLTSLPLSAALARLRGQFTTNYPEVMAASVLACLPMIAIYLVFQRQFIQSVASSGGKL